MPNLTGRYPLWYPIPGSPLIPFEDNFLQLAQSVANTLDGYDLPLAADSAAARDALYPSPSQGDRVWRRDLAVEEIYIGVYNASTNPYGAPSAGWYIDGMIPGTAVAAGSYTIGQQRLFRKGRRTVFFASVSKGSDFGTNETMLTVPVGFRPAVDPVIGSAFFTGGFTQTNAWATISSSTGVMSVNPTGVASIRSVTFTAVWDQN